MGWLFFILFVWRGNVVPVNILVMISSGHVFMNSQFREMMRYKIRNLNAC